MRRNDIKLGASTLNHYRRSMRSTKLTAGHACESQQKSKMRAGVRRHADDSSGWAWRDAD